MRSKRNRNVQDRSKRVVWVWKCPHKEFQERGQERRRRKRADLQGRNGTEVKVQGSSLGVGVSVTCVGLTLDRRGDLGDDEEWKEC